jgi:hypothetical protein
MQHKAVTLKLNSGIDQLGWVLSENGFTLP